MRTLKHSANIVQVNGNSSDPTTTSTSYVEMPEMYAKFTTNGNPVLVLVHAVIEINTGESSNVAIAVDENVTHYESIKVTIPDGYRANVTTFGVLYLDPGTYKIAAHWKTSAGTLRTMGIDRTLTIMEVK